jgi:hypothetical protein
VAAARVCEGDAAVAAERWEHSRPGFYGDGVFAEQERILLEPHLALLRAAHIELSTRQTQRTDADRRLAESTQHTTWLERLIGEPFSRDPARARAYHECRRHSRRAAAAVADSRARIAKLNERVDILLAPMMPRLDPHYTRCTAAVELCDRADLECAAMRELIAAAAAAAGTAARLALRDERGRRQAEIAGRRYVELVAQARAGGAGVRTALAAAHHAVREAGCPAPRAGWNDAVLQRLPRFGTDMPALRGLAQAPAFLHRLLRHLDRTTTAVTAWRGAAATSRANTVAAVRDRLLAGPPP